MDRGKFRVLAVRHEVDGDGNYQNSFAAPPGVAELAEVIDGADPQRLGRIRVRYYWPVKSPADAETGWVRVSTPYAGAGKGQLFTPEVGSQVLVGYEEGQAEFPLVLGNLFHPQNAQGAKYTTEGNHLKGLQTAGGNKLTFHDKAGQERIQISNGQKGKRETKLEISFVKSGVILLKTKGGITLDATEKISLISKEISLQADEKITLDSSRTVDIQGGAAVKLGGQTLDLEAQTTAKLAGQTGVTVEGPYGQALRLDDNDCEGHSGENKLTSLLMGKPAARVGGPIILPGTVTILIGGQPAATLGSHCFCVSPVPGSIMMGSPTVFIGGVPAARLFDPTRCTGAVSCLGRPRCSSASLRPWGRSTVFPGQQHFGNCGV